MWGPLLVLALLTTLNPVRLGIILVVLSRPRPIKNLFAWWLGALVIGLVSLLIPLVLLHATPASAAFMKSLTQPAESHNAQHILIGLGTVLLLGSVLLAVRSMAKAPVASGVPVHQNAATTRSREGWTAPPALALLLEAPKNPTKEDGSAVRRLLGRIRSAWKTGSPWISFFVGLIVLPPIDAAVLVLAIVVASGSAIGVQVGAVVLYVIGALVVEELILVNNMVAPERTQAALQRLQDWAVRHHQKFLAAIVAVAGIFLLVQGLGGV